MPMPVGPDEEDFDREGDIEDHWDLLLRCWDQWERLCRRCCRGRRDLVDEMMERVVDVMPQVVEAWDPTFGVPLRAHAFASVRWYLWKFLNRRMKKEVEGRRTLDYDPEGRAPELDYDSIEEVQEIMASLEEWQRYMLEARVIRGLTFPQIAVELNVSRGRAKQWYERCLDEVRTFLVFRDNDEQLGLRQGSTRAWFDAALAQHTLVGDSGSALRPGPQAATGEGAAARATQRAATRGFRAAARRVPLQAHVRRRAAVQKPPGPGQ